MSGSQTHGYDLVIEFCEAAVQGLLTTFFDGGVLADILQSIGADPGLSSPFSITISFDRPANVPAGAPDVIDVTLLFGPGGTGSLGHLRFVAGLDVDRSLPALDLVQIDLANRLEDAEVDILGLQLPGLNGVFAATLRGITAIPLVPVPVDRAATDPTTITAGDVRVIDDSSPADKDGVAFPLTFGGGAAGNRNAFTQTFMSPGGNGGIAISFAWLCRVISPLIDSSLNLQGAFTNCNLTRTVRIDDANEVDLTALSLTLDSGFIGVAATVEKSGTCYDATGTVGAKIKMVVANGQLVVQAEVDSPNVNVDIPWYCWLAAAVIGGILAGIIGAILVPLIIYISQQVVEGTVNSVAQRVANAINSVTPTINVPAVGFNLIFSDVFIDDVAIDCRVAPIDKTPIHSQGEVVLDNNSAVDLDNGQVGPTGLGGADLAWLGEGYARHLDAVCGAGSAPTGLFSFDGLTRSKLYEYVYDAPDPVPIFELASPPFGLPGIIDVYIPTELVFAVHTNEDRYSVVQVVEVTDSAVRLRYRTWEKHLLSATITGGFTCGPTGPVDRGSIAFVPSPILGAAGGPRALTPGAAPAAALASSPPRAEVCSALDHTLAALIPDRLVSEQILSQTSIQDLRIGQWTGSFVGAASGQGRFDVVTQGLGTGENVHWFVDDQPLRGASGTVQVGGARIRYAITGTTIVLTTSSRRQLDFMLGVTVTDSDGRTVSARRCVEYEPKCSAPGRYIPTWSEFHSAHMTYWGVVPVATEVKAQPALGS